MNFKATISVQLDTDSSESKLYSAPKSVDGQENPVHSSSEHKEENSDATTMKRKVPESSFLDIFRREIRRIVSSTTSHPDYPYIRSCQMASTNDYQHL